MQNTVGRVGIGWMLVMFGAGCASTRYMGPVLTPEAGITLKNESGGRPIEVVTLATSTQPSRSELTLLDVTMAGAQVDSPAGSGWIPSRQVHAAVVRDRGRGALEGMWIGTLAGLGAGLALANTHSCSPNSWGCVDAGPLVVVTSVVLGTALAATIGAVAGHRTTYRFGPAPP